MTASDFQGYENRDSVTPFQCHPSHRDRELHSSLMKEADQGSCFSCFSDTKETQCPRQSGLGWLPLPCCVSCSKRDLWLFWKRCLKVYMWYFNHLVALSRVQFQTSIPSAVSYLYLSVLKLSSGHQLKSLFLLLRNQIKTVRKQHHY